MTKYKIVYDREGCIGAAACVAVKPDSWELDSDNKAVLKGGESKDGKFEIEIDEKDVEKHVEAARVCPVNVIHVVNIDTGEQLV